MMDAKKLIAHDKLFEVKVLEATPNPQQLIWLAMHQDYSEELVWNNRDRAPDETTAGEKVIEYLLAGDRGHFGPLEHPQITVNVGYFPHSTVQQLRTHRVGISFDVQSFRYTSKQILDVADGNKEIEDVFYLRPVGEYADRQGKQYEYTEPGRAEDLQWCNQAAIQYQRHLEEEGIAEEHARGIIPFDIRQHFVMSCNARSLMHLLDLRWKKDAQLEAQAFSELLFKQFQEWCPQLAQYYWGTRAKKAKLAP